MNHEAELNFAHRLTDRASAIALRHLAVAEMTAERKNDGGPVTRADRGIENDLRSMIGSRYPPTNGNRSTDFDPDPQLWPYWRACG
ncbi:hypothetical protein EDD27_9788 [Nonomuraea polychroma]|uniref:Uncharacterized protein n=1 Tax=Nonomuraea polychroma TaxID=46176 RepID=A0A438MMN0_9ACTN|nr:hypothetical protein EDD27_9788 [Nonomuraea polychroma]